MLPFFCGSDDGRLVAPAVPTSVLDSFSSRVFRHSVRSFFLLPAACRKQHKMMTNSCCGDDGHDRITFHHIVYRYMLYLQVNESRMVDPLRAILCGTRKSCDPSKIFVRYQPDVVFIHSILRFIPYIVAKATPVGAEVSTEIHRWTDRRAPPSRLIDKFLPSSFDFKNNSQNTVCPNNHRLAATDPAPTENGRSAGRN